MNSTDGWHPTPAHARSLLGGLVLAAGAILAGRPDLLVLAVPLIGVAVWSIQLRPSRLPTIRQTVGHSTVREGDTTTWSVSIDDAEGGVEAVAAVFSSPALIDQHPPNGQRLQRISGPDGGTIRIGIRPTRWGAYRLPPVMVVGSSTWNAFRFVSASRPTDRSRLLVLPEPARFDPVSAGVRSRGLVGDNRSRRLGSGAEFASIRPFQPGDRLRRIHWPVSLRTGELHVTSTWADQDRHVVLFVDAFDDVGDSDGVDGRASSLDIALRAAAAIAEHYTRTGNRVSLITVGAHGMDRVPAAAGYHHLRRLLDVMVRCESSSGRFDRGQLPRGISGEAMVVVLSPLLSSGSHRRLATIADRGNRVVVIDCLPVDIARQYPGDAYHGLAWRMEWLRRESRLRVIRSSGIAVVPWVGPRSLDQVLRGFQSPAAARAARRG